MIYWWGEGGGEGGGGVGIGPQSSRAMPEYITRE